MGVNEILYPDLLYVYLVSKIIFRQLGPMNRCRQPYIVAALALKEAGYDVLILGTSDGEGMAKMLGGKCTNGG